MKFPILIFCLLSFNSTVNGFCEKELFSENISTANNITVNENFYFVNNSDALSTDTFRYIFPLESQETVAKKEIVLDTFSFKYHFEKGDTLIYSVFSRDSIMINYGAPLLRLRHEKIMITCDSITPDGDFCLTQKLISFRATESFLKEKNVPRNTTPWLNVPVYLEIDSLGRRKKTSLSENSKGAITPGGPFQPFLLLPLLDSNDNENIKVTNESWMFSRTDDISENGFPTPLLRYSMLFRMIGITDTLEYNDVLKMTFIKTSQGAIVVSTDELNVITTSINNAGGEIFWDTTNWVPILYWHTVEQRLTIHDQEAQTSDPGFHYIHSTFVLDEFRRRKP